MLISECVESLIVIVEYALIPISYGSSKTHSILMNVVLLLLVVKGHYYNSNLKKGP